MANTADNKIAIIKEVVKGTTPATPSFKWASVKEGSALTYAMKELSSETMTQNRDAAGIRKVAGSGSGSLNFEFRRDDVITDLMAAGLSGVVNANVCKGSNVDTSFTVEEHIDGDQTLYFRNANAHVNKFNIKVDAEGKASIAFDILSAAETRSETALTGSTYADSDKGQELIGRDVGTITVGNLVGKYLELDMEVSQDREVQFALGERDGFAVSANGTRKVTLKLKMFRKGLEADTLFEDDTPVAVSFKIGEGENGYQFDFPAMVGAVEKEANGAKQLVNITLTAQYDPTTGYASSFTLLS